MRDRIFIFLIMMVVVFIPTAGFSEGENYVAFRGGSFSPDESDYDSGTHVEGAFGKYINDGFVAEGALGQYSSKAEFSGWGSLLWQLDGDRRDHGYLSRCDFKRSYEAIRYSRLICWSWYGVLYGKI